MIFSNHLYQLLQQHLHEEVLKVLVYKLKRDKDAVEYCKELLKLKEEQTKSSKPIEPDEDLRNVHPFVLLLDICLSPEKYKLPDVSPNRTIPKILLDYASYMDDEALLDSIDPAKMNIAMMKAFLKNVSFFSPFQS